MWRAAKAGFAGGGKRAFGWCLAFDSGGPFDGGYPAVRGSGDACKRGFV